MRRDQIDIKFRATTKYLQMLIYYKRMHTDQYTDHVCTCMLLIWWQIQVIVQNLK